MLIYQRVKLRVNHAQSSPFFYGWDSVLTVPLVMGVVSMAALGMPSQKMTESGYDIHSLPWENGGLASSND